MMRLHQPSSNPLIAESIDDLRADLATARKIGKTIGFIPTMGALHAGHISLMERARAECDLVVSSIFVNPTQFGPNEDFQKYPRPREKDLQICGDAGVDIVFYPTSDVMYPPGFRTIVEVQGLSDVLEGAVRPGHFRGVTTVVTKLFMIVGADMAYFGQKDYQQQLLIQVMANELNISTKVITCPTLRDPDGLAMSSRNAYLSASERKNGLCLSRSLNSLVERVDAGERDLPKLRKLFRDQMSSSEGVVLDYAVIVDAKSLQELPVATPEMVALVAARVGSTRLIDNMILRFAAH